LRYFTASGITKIHDYVIEALGGESGPLNEGNVQAASERPRTKVYHSEPFEDLVAKAAALCYAYRWHGFLDGNKRTALMSLILMLEMNGAYLTNPPYMTKYLVLVAQDKISEEDFQRFVRRLVCSNRLLSIWKDFRYDRWLWFWYDSLYYFPPTRRYGEHMEADWFGAGDLEALERLNQEYDTWEKLGFPKGDVELRIAEDIQTAIKDGDIVEE
jgi:death-on-curing protein